MKKIQFYIIASLCIAAVACNAPDAKYDTEEMMLEKCKHLNGLDSLILNETTIDDIYKKFPAENIKTDVTHEYSPNLEWHENEEGKMGWTRISLENYSDIYYDKDVTLDFYKDTLTEIHFRYDGYLENCRKEKKFAPDVFIEKFGHGRPVQKEYLDSLCINTYSASYNDVLGDEIKQFRKYMNENVHMILWTEHWDVVIIHQPRLQRLLSEIREVKEARSSAGYSSERKRGHNSMDSDDDEYWNSVAREKALKDAGLYDAAKIERKARLDYLKGGGYTSTDGGSQVHYQGSKEQKEHLEEMDRRGW